MRWSSSASLPTRRGDHGRRQEIRRYRRKKCGVECIGVRFGYAEPGELEREGAVYVAENADDLYKYLTK